MSCGTSNDGCSGGGGCGKGCKSGESTSAVEAPAAFTQSPSSAKPNRPGAAAPSLDSVTTIRDDGSRRFVHAADVRGPFTRWRTVVGLLLVGIYVALPWIPINGQPAVFMDVLNLQFHFFGLTFLVQDMWLGFFLLTGLGFGLFYLTALIGRVWCGWACPQTVFVDIARRIERWFEGDAPARRKLDSMARTAESQGR